MKVPDRFAQPPVTKQLRITVPHGVDPDGVAVDIPAAMKEASQRKPGESSDYDIRLLIHLMHRQFAKIDPKAVGDPAEYIRQMRDGFAPRDQFESVLIGAILLTNSRLAHLMHNAATTKDEFELPSLFAAADRTTLVLRKQLVTLADYRRPIFGARVDPEESVKMTNKKGFDHAAQTLLNDKEGIAIAPGKDCDKPSLAENDRS